MSAGWFALRGAPGRGRVSQRRMTGSGRNPAFSDVCFLFSVTAKVGVEGSPSSRAKRGDPGEHRAPYVPLDRRAAKARLKDARLSTPYGGSR
jgi:hypothetical protein